MVLSDLLCYTVQKIEGRRVFREGEEEWALQVSDHSSVLNAGEGKTSARSYCLLFLLPFPAVPLATIPAVLEMARSIMILTSAGGQFDGLMLTDCIW